MLTTIFAKAEVHTVILQLYDSSVLVIYQPNYQTVDLLILSEYSPPGFLACSGSLHLLRGDYNDTWDHRVLFKATMCRIIMLS